jgi:ferritin
LKLEDVFEKMDYLPKEKLKMISEKIQNAINDQIKAEFDSFYLYLAMAAFCESINFKGFAAWFRMQAEEEKEHAYKFYNYVIDRGGRVILKGLETPPAQFNSMQDVFQQTLDHERVVTGRINHIYQMAVEEKDFATQEHLNWFVKEQVEEEASATEMLEQIKMTEGRLGNLMYLDRHAGKRGKS